MNLFSDRGSIPLASTINQDVSTDRLVRFLFDKLSSVRYNL